MPRVFVNADTPCTCRIFSLATLRSFVPAVLCCLCTFSCTRYMCCTSVTDAERPKRHIRVRMVTRSAAAVVMAPSAQAQGIASPIAYRSVATCHSRRTGGTASAYGYGIHHSSRSLGLAAGRAHVIGSSRIRAHDTMMCTVYPSYTAIVPPSKGEARIFASLRDLPTRAPTGRVMAGDPPWPVVHMALACVRTLRSTDQSRSCYRDGSMTMIPGRTIYAQTLGVDPRDMKEQSTCRLMLSAYRQQYSSAYNSGAKRSPINSAARTGLSCGPVYA
jgi:hypothetical protein